MERGLVWKQAKRYPSSHRVQSLGQIRQEVLGMSTARTQSDKTLALAVIAGAYEAMMAWKTASSSGTSLM